MGNEATAMFTQYVSYPAGASIAAINGVVVVP
jgi:hypothetical protein